MPCPQSVRLNRIVKAAFTALPVPIQAATHVLRRSKSNACGGPMNGQQARQRLVRAIMGWA